MNRTPAAEAESAAAQMRSDTIDGVVGADRSALEAPSG